MVACQVQAVDGTAIGSQRGGTTGGLHDGAGFSLRPPAPIDLSLFAWTMMETSSPLLSSPGLGH